MNPEHELTPISSPDNSIRLFGSLRSRYRAFIEKYKEPASPGKRTRLGRGLLRSASFSALVVAILAVLWIGLSWFGSGSQKAKGDQLNQSASQSADQPVNQSPNQSATRLANQPATQSANQPATRLANPSANQSANPSASKPADAKASISLPPALPQPTGPAGHAELRPESTPGKKTDGQ